MLALALGSTVASLAGCVGAPGGGGDDGDSSDEEVPDALERGRVAAGPTTEVDLPVAESDLTRGAPRDAIPAIVDPVFGADWTDVSADVPRRGMTIQGPTRKTIEPRLRKDDAVIGVARAGEARAYPLRVLNWHEVVNDHLGGPLLVTYCPLCRTAVTAERRAGGDMSRFGVSGLLFRNDLVMYDEATDSRWSQLLATAIQGPLTGERLDLVPSTLTTLGAWRESHPNTTVLRPPPESGTVGGEPRPRDYTRNPYAGYQESRAVGLDRDDGEFDEGYDGERLHPKTEVLGVAHGEVARAYPAERVREERLIEDGVGGLPVVVTTTPDGTPVAWSREVDGDVLSFVLGDDRHLRGGGSRWRRATGDAVDGPHEGQRLAQANAVSPLFWFAWLEFYPETGLYGAGE